jgi:hypothetical protein
MKRNHSNNNSMFNDPKQTTRSFNISSTEQVAMLAKKISIATLAVFSIAATAAILDQKPASASTSFCNRTGATIYVAYARSEYLYSTDGGKTTIGINDDPEPVTVRGWWQLTSGQCKTPNSASATNYCKGKNCYSVYASYYAFTNEGYKWGGNQTYCVTNSAFTRGFSSGGYGSRKSQSCPSGYYEAGFKPISSSKKNKTISLFL